MNIASLLVRAALAYPELPAVARGTAVVCSQLGLLRRVAILACGLRHQHGLAPGERVAVAMTNCPEAIKTLYAIWYAGLAAVPINAKLHPREFAHILADSGAKLAFVTPDLAEAIASVKDDCPDLRAIIATDSAEYRRLHIGDPIGMQAREGDDLAWLFYTSGTTGKPKGAMLSHRNLLTMTMGYFADVDDVAWGAPVIHGAPISHGSGLYNFPFAARAGVQVIPESGKYEPDETVALFNRWKGASMFLAPTMVKRLVEHKAAAEIAPGALKTIIYGGGPMYVADLKKGLERLGNVFVQIYGQGESPMTISTLSRAVHADRAHPRWEQRLASAGLPQACVEARVTDEQGGDLPAGEVGEIVVKGDVVMGGYWNNAAATARALRQGWLFTGDMGSFDAEGFLTLKDRSKDLVISGGSNIYPREVEEVLLRHPAVLECSAVGRPHPEWGEELVAFIVAKPGRPPTPAELDALCLANIARFKRPKDYKFVAVLPKNNYGKVLKTELRKLL